MFLCYMLYVCFSRYTVWYTEEMLLDGSLAQLRALTRDGALDKVNGNLVPRTRCLVLETLLATLRTCESAYLAPVLNPFA